MHTLGLFFRVVYRFFYILLHLLLVALLLVSPGDISNQARLRDNYVPILIVGLGYVLTVLLVLFVYITRLIINKNGLKAIPKSWMPIDKGDVSKRVRKMIVANLSRSAAIAFSSRPRLVEPEMISAMENPVEEKEEEKDDFRRKSMQLLRLKKTATMEEEMGIKLPPLKPVWGEIEHLGWASPESPDLPNLQYSSVILELPNLIEAKALTLAPPDPTSQTEPPMLDAEAVGLLQRPLNIGLRGYLLHLADLGVLEASALITDFIVMYEDARFSTRMISNARFRELMHNFAEILRSMQPLDPAVLYPDSDDDGNGAASASDSDIDNDAPLGTGPSTPASGRLSSDTSRVVRRQRRPPLAGRGSSASGTWQQAYRTAPTTPKSRRAGVSLSRSSSVNSFAQTRQPYALSSHASSASLRSSAAGSVIRLPERREETGGLPYVLTLPEGV
jgi:hypothetical protein